MKTSLILASLWRDLLNWERGVQEDAEEAGAVGEEEQVLGIPGPLMVLTLGARGSLNGTVAVIERVSEQRRKGEAMALATGDP